MSRPNLRFSALISGATVTGALLLAACGSPSPSLDATCGDFGDMSDEDQKATAQLVLEDKGIATDGLGAGAKISGALVALKAYCAASGETAKVGNAADAGSEIENLIEQAKDAAAEADSSGNDAGNNSGNGNN